MTKYGQLTFQRFQEIMIERTDESFHPVNDWSPNEYGLAICEEAGEVAGVLKRVRRLEDGANRPYNKGVTPEKLKQNLADELGDVIAYAALLCTRCGLDLGTVVAEKFNEISERVGSQKRL